MNQLSKKVFRGLRSLESICTPSPLSEPKRKDRMKMATLQECFTQSEWRQLMEAKEMVGHLPINLEVRQSKPGATGYKLSFGKIELNGSGFDVATALWPDTEAILRSQFNIGEEDK